MTETEFLELVVESLRETTAAEFDRRVDEQAARLAEALRSGNFDSPGFALGLELEAYAVDATGRLTETPEAVFEGPCGKELGVHNVELHTDPDPFEGTGIETQAAKLDADYRAARLRAGDAAIVLDGMWTTPPEAGSDEYLCSVRTEEGVSIAENMTRSPRYCAIDNDILRRTGGRVDLSVPGAESTFPTILVESLACSIQPHLQIPEAAAFPRYYNAAIRTMGPVLALSTNSPLLPADLYDGDPETILEETHHELRIEVFEQSINGAFRKVRFPADLEATTDVVDRLIADETCAPFLYEWIAGGDRETLEDRLWELNHKRGTYWRWLRAVAGGQPVNGGDERSIRIEYRPLPTQPTVHDTIGLQCLVAGLVRGLIATDHPLVELEHTAAREGFYDAARNGLEAELPWITADGERTTDPEILYPDLFETAREGLERQGVEASTIETYLDPIEARWKRRTTPSRWKLTRVRDRLEAGATFEAALEETTAEYVRRSTSGERFLEWSR